MAKIRVTQTRSKIGQSEKHRGTLRALRVPPGGSRTITAPLRPVAGDRCVARFTVTPTKVPGKGDFRRLGMHFLGGATLDTEENYLIKKLFTAAGAISVENQARI